MSDPIVIVSVARTPIGSMNGEMSSFAGHELGAFAIKAALERAGLKPEQIQEVIMGCVLPAGQGQAPARQAALRAGLGAATVCTTVNKVRFGAGSLRAWTAPPLAAHQTVLCARALTFRPAAGVRVGHEGDHARRAGHRAGPLGRRRGGRLRVHVQRAVLAARRPLWCVRTRVAG
jgi:hypothetical protein